MPSYRFCRPDDIPFLVKAINHCYNVHFPGLPEMTVDAFREEMKALSVWPSNSMVARNGDDPIAVLIGTKRVDEVLILRMGVHPEHLHQGHGSHLMTSLSQKLAVLGPPRLIVEVPTALPGLRDFVQAVHYRYEATYTDYVWRPDTVKPVPDGLIIPATVQDLLDDGALTVPNGVAWVRSSETLALGKDDLQGLAIASPERIEAWLLYPAPESLVWPRGNVLDVVALGCRDPERRSLFVSLLLRDLATKNDGLTIRLPRLSAMEATDLDVEALGFIAGATYERHAAVASPG